MSQHCHNIVTTFPQLLRPIQDLCKAYTGPLTLSSVEWSLNNLLLCCANKRATAILADPENVRLYKQKNKLERGISSGSPRGYVLSMLIKEIKPPLKTELETLGTIDGKTPEQWRAFLDPRSRSYHKE